MAMPTAALLFLFLLCWSDSFVALSRLMSLAASRLMSRPALPFTPTMVMLPVFGLVWLLASVLPVAVMLMPRAAVRLAPCATLSCEVLVEDDLLVPMDKES